MSRWFFRPLRSSEARTILSWRYSPPYDFYNDTRSGPELDAAASEMAQASSGYFALHNAAAELEGFCCVGKEARVPGGDYSREALDIGVGMRPDLTGQGLGDAFMQAVLTFLIERYRPRRLRATVALFNERAQALCRSLGFAEVDRFARPSDGVFFCIFERDL